MAEKRISSVETLPKGVQVEVVSGQAHNPMVVGYSPRRPIKVAAGEKELNEVSSRKRLSITKEGWFWDDETKLWYVKTDFADVTDMASRPFRIYF